MSGLSFKPARGRGATLSPDNRYARERREPVDDGWWQDEEIAPLHSTVTEEDCRRIITYNESPDLDFDRSVNPYRGCEHGCVYCFARPTHAWMDLSPGLDFETRLFSKPAAPRLLRRELARPSYRCAPLALGINTDAYQPLERRLTLTRQIIEVLVETQHPFSIVTKSALIERDLDLIAVSAGRRQAAVAVSLTPLRRQLARRMEPRAAAPQRRLAVIRKLADAGIPVTVLVAPLIPVLCDAELEDILAAAREAGARHAGYIVLRLPHELKAMFRSWLECHVPLQAAHVMSRLQAMHGGRDYDARFGNRLSGTGTYARLLAQRFRLASRKLGFEAPPPLDCSRFQPPADGQDGQLALF